MRIAFVGLPLAALLLARDGHTIVWAGICRRGAIGTRRLRRIVGEDDLVILPDLARSVAKVRARAPDLVVSWFWTKNVPRAFREIAPRGAIGVHPSLLPRHRGPDPYFWAIDAGDEVTGVTAHELDDAYDTGAVLGQRALRIDASWNAWTLAKKLDRPSLALLCETVRGLEARMLRASAQDEARATPAPQPTDDDLELRWSWDSARIERRVRAASPWPGTFTSIGDRTVTVTRVRATDAYPRALAAGEAAVRADGVAVVRCADGAVELVRGRLDDDDDDGDGEELDARALGELVRRCAIRAI